MSLPLLICASVLAAPGSAKLQDGLRGRSFPAPKYRVADRGSSLEIGDVDGDGSNDILTAIETAGVGGAAVLFGRTDGTFEGLVQLSAGPGTSRSASGDLDGDGDRDVVVTTQGTGDVWLFENLGGRAFDAGVVLGNSSQAGSVLLTDADGDSDLDVLVSSFSRTRVQLYINDGTGALMQGQDLVLFGPGPFMQLADMNRDGFQDLVLTEFSGQRIQICPGSASGFAFPAMFTAPFSLRRPYVDDIDLDGWPDLIAVAWQTDQLAYFPGTGALSFGTPILSSIVSESRQVTSADLDGVPGKELLVLANSTFTQRLGRVRVLPADPAGIFAPPSAELLGGTAPQEVKASDVDGDGVPDLVCLDTRGYLTVLRGEDGTTYETPAWTAEPLFDTGLSLAAGLAVGDLDGVAPRDMVLADGGGRRLLAWTGRADGSFVLASNTDLGELARLSEGRDLDGDGDLDVVVTLERSGASLQYLVRSYLGDGAGLFALSQELIVGTDASAPLALHDLDRDGNFDILRASNVGNRSINVHYGVGNGTFGPEQTVVPATQMETLELHDMDGDGLLDVVGATDPAGGFRVYRSTSSGDFLAPWSVDHLFGNLVRATIPGDFDGDGVGDVMAIGVDDPNGGPTLVRPYFGDGTGTFTAGADLEIDQDYTPFGVTDEDLDGKNEIAFRYMDGLTLLRVDPSGQPELSAPYGWAERSIAAVPADFDGDGNVDLAAVSELGLILLHHRADTRLDAYCDQGPNSTGEPARLGWTGTRSLARGDLELLATRMPSGQPLVWFAGMLPFSRPLGPGTLCIGGSLIRLGAPVTTGGIGAAQLTVAAAGAPALVGETTYFQAWYADPLGVAPGFNFSNGVAVRFLP